ncbi:MAG: hypothetical protein IKQ03_06035 [Prevotella sp.]|nr:hypothetical protein [Prevotella sp.]
MGKVKKWTNSNGNKCFRFSERQVFDRPWIIVLVAILLFASTGTEYLVNSSYYTLTPNLIFFFFVFLWWMTKPLKANEAVIEKTIHEMMDDLVEADATAAGTNVAKSFVYYDTKGTYAIITGRCFLVLLRSGEVWEYPIKYHITTDEEDGYYECKKKYVVSDNHEHIRAIQPSGWRNFLVKKDMSEKAKLWMLIIVILFIGGMIFAGAYWTVMRLKWWTLLLLGGYFFLFETTERIAKMLPENVANAVKRIISLPLIIGYFLISFVQPFIIIVGTYFFTALFAFGVPAIILTGLSKVEWFHLRPETIAFVVLALGSILSSNYSVTKNIIRHTPLKDWGNHTYESYREKLAFYLVHPSNMVFLIYLIYFVFLAVSGYQFIESGEYMISESFDMSIFKAFLVYIAYTNMRAKAKETEIEAKELLIRISSLFEHDK